METLGLSIDAAMNALKVPEDERYTFSQGLGSALSAKRVYHY